MIEGTCRGPFDCVLWLAVRCMTLGLIAFAEEASHWPTGEGAGPNSESMVRVVSSLGKGRNIQLSPRPAGLRHVSEQLSRCLGQKRWWEPTGPCWGRLRMESPASGRCCQAGKDGVPENQAPQQKCLWPTGVLVLCLAQAPSMPSVQA